MGHTTKQIWVPYVISNGIEVKAKMFLTQPLRPFQPSRVEGATFMTSQPPKLASTLVKISCRVQATPKSKLEKLESMNAFFIIPASMATLFSTHPPLQARVERLMEIEAQMRASRA